MVFYRVLLAVALILLSLGIFHSNAFGYLCGILIALALTALLRHYSALYVLGIAAVNHGYARYFLARGAITVATLSPLLLVAMAWLLHRQGILNRLAFYLAVAAAAGSSLMTAYYEFERLAAWYPRYSALTLFGSLDYFALAGVLVPIVVCIKVVPRVSGRTLSTPVRRADSGLHGQSDWFPIARARRWFGSGGIVIGEAYRPDREPHLGGRAPLLRYDGNTGSGHLLVFAGSGGYKTTATGIPSALEWPSGLVYLDPSTEVLPLVYAARRALNHRVVALNPEDPDSAGFNVLDWIDTASDRALLDVQAVVAWLAGESPGERYEDYFRHAARALLGCLLADILFSTDLAPEQKTLALLRRRVALPIPELRELLEGIYLKGNAYGFGFPAQLAGNLKDIADKQFSGFYGEAGNATAWLAVPSLARLVCGSSFQTRHLLSGKLDVFINLPLKVLQSTPQAARVILGSLLNAVYEARGQVGGRMLFLLDEVARLGYMSILETARDAGRKYGINLCLLYQSIGQLTATYGPQGRQAWFDSAYLKLFAFIQDLEAAEMLSRSCGEFTAIGESSSEGTGQSNQPNRFGSSTSFHSSQSQNQLARRLIKPEEVLQNLRYDEQIVLVQNAPPLRCGRAVYFRRPDMLARVKGNGAQVGSRP